jgi:unsaturated chondroitin disaccharide hydrolase
MRTLRVLVLADRLGQVMKGEGDKSISLLGRAIAHARTTARYAIFYGEGRDIYDVRGRTAHEAIFNINNGVFRSVAAQQGYSGFTTWTRGLSWAICGFAELLEFIETVEAANLDRFGGKPAIVAMMDRAAAATCDFYLSHTTTDGIPYWDTGAPGLRHIANPYDRPADPGNDFEPVDSSAAAIAAQGLLRYGAWRRATGRASAEPYVQAGLTVLATLLGETYLSTDPDHQGLLLHSQYHRPNGWDYVPPGHRTPFGEATMWGDYHLRELALYVQRLAAGGPGLTFFGGGGGKS